ncbi:hypothetical protein EDB85DRAFT_1887398 [Lactarius pseudohatsudake]|nr:hypothetical protein EDB85DRAFT_1887398 [Lactarius pseudohatsudake]
MADRGWWSGMGWQRRGWGRDVAWVAQWCRGGPGWSGAGVRSRRGLWEAHRRGGGVARLGWHKSGWLWWGLGRDVAREACGVAVTQRGGGEMACLVVAVGVAMSKRRKRKKKTYFNKAEAEVVSQGFACRDGMMSRGELLHGRVVVVENPHEAKGGGGWGLMEQIGGRGWRQTGHVIATAASRKFSTTTTPPPRHRCLAVSPRVSSWPPSPPIHDLYLQYLTTQKPEGPCHDMQDPPLARLHTSLMRVSRCIVTTQAPPWPRQLCHAMSTPAQHSQARHDAYKHRRDPNTARNTS